MLDVAAPLWVSMGLDGGECNTGNESEEYADSMTMWPELDGCGCWCCWGGECWDWGRACGWVLAVVVAPLRLE